MKVFSMLHDMDDACINLELNHLHPGVVYEDRSAASDAITLFRKGRPTFHRDHIGRDRAYRMLQGAGNLIKSSLRRYDRLLKVNVLVLANPPPQVGNAVTSKTKNARWDYGMPRGEKVDITSTAQVRSIKLADGFEGQECLLKAKSKGSIFKRTDEFRFSGHHGGSRAQGPLQPNVYMSNDLVTVIGFSLSCDNARGVPVKFTITEGGILSSSLSVDVSIPSGCEWHCRVLFIKAQWGQLENLSR